MNVYIHIILKMNGNMTNKYTLIHNTYAFFVVFSQLCPIYHIRLH